MGISAEFARYNARLANIQWAVSALTDSELVVSLWQHRMRTNPDGSWTYRDFLRRWSGNGNRLFGEHLQRALAENRPVRLVLARTSDVALIERGGDGSKARNHFKAHPERIGTISAFDGDAFEIVFARPVNRTD